MVHRTSDAETLFGLGAADRHIAQISHPLQSSPPLIHSRRGITLLCVLGSHDNTHLSHTLEVERREGSTCTLHPTAALPSCSRASLDRMRMRGARLTPRARGALGSHACRIRHLHTGEARAQEDAAALHGMLRYAMLAAALHGMLRYAMLAVGELHDSPQGARRVLGVCGRGRDAAEDSQAARARVERIREHLA